MRLIVSSVGAIVWTVIVAFITITAK